ncbi:protein adenylyltransferase SelO family protein [Photobacterium frigidiphilum]|uniref:protein adenylyltransferase SelO family protein n=1 Tax=Photobacterium frigidiphilum TaxID=264736 RepID=UPI003D137865
MKIETFNSPSKENTILIEDKLPEISFVPFQAFKLNKADVVWVNGNLVRDLGLELSSIENDILENYAYVSNGYTDVAKINFNDKKTFLADRYGSRYEVCNGGSARCGINGQFQIKGIGVNPLVSNNIDEHHSHGKLCLSEAVNEAIWGELCHKYLPHGAIRTLAIIDTHTEVRSFYGLNDSRNLPCALAIREASVRPAHFERATFFLPEKGYEYLRDNDSERVKKTISYLSSSFSPNYNDDNSRVENTYNSLVIFAERLAEQLAVSRIHGIPHGSLTSSNISCDGRFVDFGTITAVPDFSNFILGSEQRGVWDDHYLIIEWLKYLVFYINKYSVKKISASEFNSLASQFSTTLKLTENEELSKILHLKVKNKTLQMIKDELCSSGNLNREFDEITTPPLLNQIGKALSKYNIKHDISKINFPLRNKRYSQGFIINEIMKLTSGGCVKKERISNFINSYTK